MLKNFLLTETLLTMEKIVLLAVCFQPFVNKVKIFP